MLLGLFKNVSKCVLNSPKIGLFGESDTGATSKVKSPCNLGDNQLIITFLILILKLICGVIVVSIFLLVLSLVFFEADKQVVMFV